MAINGDIISNKEGNDIMAAIFKDPKILLIP